MRPRSSLRAALLLLALVGCRPPMPELRPEPPTLRRLTNRQYANTVHALLGADIVIPRELDPDQRSAGLLVVGAAITAVSPRGVENVEASSYVIAAQALDEAHRDALVPCVPGDVVDAACSRAFVTEFGRRAWRRPLTSAEVERLASLGDQAASVLGDFFDGLQYALAALIQAPDFLYRVELGADTDDGRVYTDFELASRLSYLLWDSTPDDALLDAAEGGRLADDEGLRAEVERMLLDPRAREGLTAWFEDLMRLDKLDALYKEPSVFPHMSDTLGASAREEARRSFQLVAFDRDSDLRDLLTSRTGFVNRELAAIYDLRAPVRDGFAAVEHPEEAGRVGLLGQVAFLALNAHAVSTSATLRGKFIREVFLCAELPGPPADADTSIPPITEEARTLRDRVAQHLSDPGCAGCHLSMDPVGLGLEAFDGIGRARTHEEGEPIDASGELDGVEFLDGAGLAAAVRDHEDFGPCLVTMLVRAANGVHEEPAQFEALDWLAEGFAEQDHRLEPLLLEFTSSPLFRAAGVIDTAPLEAE